MYGGMKRKGAAKSGSLNRRGFSATGVDERGGGTGDSADTVESSSEADGSAEASSVLGAAGFFAFQRRRVETASGSTEMRSPGCSLVFASVTCRWRVCGRGSAR